MTENVEFTQSSRFLQVFQIMDCVRAIIDSVFELLCCPDGTTIFKESEKVSFSPVRDVRCPFIQAATGGSPTTVTPRWPFYLVISCFLAIGVLASVFFLRKRRRAVHDTLE